MSLKNVFDGTMVFMYEHSNGAGCYKNFKECWDNEPKKMGKEKTIFLTSYWKDKDGMIWLVEELPLHKRPTLKQVRNFMRESMLPKAHCQCDFTNY